MLEMIEVFEDAEELFEDEEMIEWSEEEELEGERVVARMNLQMMTAL